MENSKRFVLFKNDYKKEGDNKPDYKGFLYLEDGTVKDLAGWVKENDKGKYISGVYSEQRTKTEPEATTKADDSLPF